MRSAGYVWIHAVLPCCPNVFIPALPEAASVSYLRMFGKRLHPTVPSHLSRPLAPSPSPSPSGPRLRVGQGWTGTRSAHPWPVPAGRCPGCAAPSAALLPPRSRRAGLTPAPANVQRRLGGSGWAAMSQEGPARAAGAALRCRARVPLQPRRALSVVLIRGPAAGIRSGSPQMAPARPPRLPPGPGDSGAVPRALPAPAGSPHGGAARQRRERAALQVAEEPLAASPSRLRSCGAHLSLGHLSGGGAGEAALPLPRGFYGPPGGRRAERPGGDSAPRPTAAAAPGSCGSITSWDRPPAFSVRVSPALGTGAARQQVRPGSGERRERGSAGGARSELSLRGGTAGTARRDRGRAHLAPAGARELCFVRVARSGFPRTSLSSPSCRSVPRTAGSYPLLSHSNGQAKLQPSSSCFRGWHKPQPSISSQTHQTERQPRSE